MQANNITDPKINAVSQRVVQAAKEALGDKLDKVILYGSYARGDYDNESDIDFFILADIPQEEVISWQDRVFDSIPNIDLEFDILVSLCVTGKTTFEQCIGFLPFYRNVLNEGVLVND